MKITPATIFTNENIREPLAHRAYVAVSLVSPTDGRVRGSTTVQVPAGCSIFARLTSGGYTLHSVKSGEIRASIP